MGFTLLDIIYILTIFVLTPLIWVLLLKGRKQTSNKMMSLFLGIQVLYPVKQLMLSHYSPVEELSFFIVLWRPVYALWGPTLYLFIRSETSSTFILKRKQLIHLWPSMVMTLLIAIDFNHYLHHPFNLINLDRLSSLFILFYCIISIRRLEGFATENRLKNATVLKQLLWNRFILYGYTVSFLLNGIVAIIYWYSGEGHILIHVSGLIFLIYFTALLYRSLLSSHFSDRNKKESKYHLNDQESQAFFDALEQFMKQEKPFLEYNLTLNELASYMGVKDRYLSQVINSFMKMTFQDYVNRFRIEEAQTIITENKKNGKTILEVVYECGFNSKSAFNFAFKKHTGLTPTQFRKNRLPDHSI